MLTQYQRDQIFSLLDSGMSISRISRQLQMSIGTVYKYQRQRNQPDSSDSQEVKISRKILPFKEEIDLRWKRGEKNIMKIFHCLQKEGFTGSSGLVYSYVNEFITSKDQKNYKRSTRFETGPGEQGQVDWAHFGQVNIHGRKEKLYAFVYILSYSRAAYVEFVVRQKQTVLQNCHIHAFEKLGIPQTILYDNMKTVLLRRKKLANGQKEIHWNPSFQEFAKYYGFEPNACHPYWPREKGKVEAMVKYLKKNFADGNIFKKSFTSLEDLNQKVAQWLDEVANDRIHRSTKIKPRILWKKENPFLTFPQGLPPYLSNPLLSRRSTKDGLIQYKSVFYSVPMEYALKKLSIREMENGGLPLLEIYDQHELIARHDVSTRRGNWVIDDRHLSPKKKTNKNHQAKKIKKMISVSVPARELEYYNLVS